MVLMVFSLQLSAQKHLQDSLNAIFKENAELRKAVIDHEKI